MEGIIDRYIKERAYGFIKSPQIKDHFFHKDDLEFEERFVTPGLNVKFKSVETNRGMRARSVERI